MVTADKAEIIRASFEAWNRGDWDEALKDAAPDFVLDSSMNIGEWRGVHRGPEEVKRAWHLVRDPWDSVRFEPTEFIEVSDDEIISRQRVHFVGRDGIELPGPVNSGWLWKFRGGKAVYVATYNDVSEALEAAGLSE